MTETGFGDLLRRHRIAAGLTQEALAERAGLSTRGISDLERGARELPRKDTLRLLLQALDLAPADRAALVAAARHPLATALRGAHVDRLSGLPVALTPLIGRETDVASVVTLLNEPAVRLVTLTGPGGTGKTRLALPSAVSAPGRDQLALVPAVQLFVARAQDVKADFALTDENASAVAEICQRLDGLPLAVELAAARIKILSPAALLARLNRRLPLLTGGPRDLPDRQQTLRNTMAWSHDLLGEQERAVFRRLGVFAGGWTLEAAEAVANRDGAIDVLEGLASLVDNSLVRQSDQLDDEPRFMMLETIRDFALERLSEDTTEEQAVGRAHAAFFADQVLAAWVDLTAGVPKAVRRVRAEEADHRGMLTYLLEAGDVETALRVLGSLSEYWTVSGGQFSEARGWLDRALLQGEVAGNSPAARAWALYGLTILAALQGDHIAGRRAGTEGLALGRASHDPLLVALGAFALSLVEEEGGRRDVAASLVFEALAAARAAQEPATLGWTLQAFGRHRFHAGDLDRATAALEEALALFRGCGGVWGEGNTLAALALVTRAQDNLARSAQLLADALRLRRDSELLADVYGDLLGVIDLAHLTNQAEAAARLLGAEDAYCTRFGYVGIGGIATRREQVQRELLEQLGDERFGQAWEAGRALSIEEAIDEALILADELATTQV